MGPIARILLTVAAAGLLAGCGDQAATPTTKTATTASRGPATTLTYEAGSADAAADVGRAAGIVRERLGGLGTEDAGVERSGARRIVVTLPDRVTADRVKRALAASGRLLVYDWEPNVIGEDGHRHPADEAVTGGASAGQPGAGTMPRAQATRIARRHVPAIAVHSAYDETSRASRAVARDAYLVLGGTPALTGADLAGAEVAADEATGQPVVDVALTEAGQAAFRVLSRAVADRGKVAMRKAGGEDFATTAANHFAFVLDGRVLSVPYLDPVQNPHGVDGSDGVRISGGFTRASAQELAALLAAGPMPASLRLVDERPA